MCLSFSLAPIQFQWESETSPNIVEIKPPMGVIGPGEIADLEVTVTGLECGPLACDLLCRIEHQEKPIRLNVVANIEGPTVAVGKFLPCSKICGKNRREEQCRKHGCLARNSVEVGLGLRSG